MPSPAAEPDSNPRTLRWPWIVFALAMVWAAVIRIPLVLNAPAHLDSDLAVDGLTLLDAVNGHWRWHYPGTPFMGIGPVFASLPQALVLGTNAQTLVSGGVVLYLLLMLATFLLGWKAFGPGVAAWSLVPLTFASNGAVWLSGRITGGHLLAAAWHAGAFFCLANGFETPARKRSAALLGLWSGVGLYLDSMFAVSIMGLVASALWGWRLAVFSRHGLVAAVLFLGMFLIGVSPRPVGARLDPYDAYQDQFATVHDPALFKAHGKILALQCLPRLITGHLLPGLETDPNPNSLAGQTARRRGVLFEPLAAGVACLSLVLAVLATLSLKLTAILGHTPTSRAIAFGLTISTLATLGGFVVNRNIFNSDNYRYLVTLLVPWTIGFGLFSDWLCRKGRAGGISASALAAVFAVLMTVDLERWYARFGWVDDRGIPVRKSVEDSTLAWLTAHPEVAWIEGGYWDVYRLIFLVGGQIKGAPLPIYPNRFPDWSPAPGTSQALILRLTPEVGHFREAALRSGRRVVSRSRGVEILQTP